VPKQEEQQKYYVFNTGLFPTLIDLFTIVEFKEENAKAYSYDVTL